MGVSPRAPPSARGGLGGQPQAGAAAVARGGAAGAADARRKRRRLGDSTVPARAAAGRAPEPGVGVRFPARPDRRRPRDPKLLNVVDEFTREALAMQVERSIDADTSSTVLDAARRPSADAPGVRADGQRAGADRARAQGLVSVLRGPAARSSSRARRGRTRSWSRSTRRVRDELLDVEEFSCLAEAKVVIEDWREDYNHAPAALRARDARPRRVRRRLHARHRRMTPPGTPARTEARRSARPRARLRDELPSDQAPSVLD